MGNRSQETGNDAPDDFYEPALGDFSEDTYDDLNSASTDALGPSARTRDISQKHDALQKHELAEKRRRAERRIEEIRLREELGDDDLEFDDFSCPALLIR